MSNRIQPDNTAKLRARLLSGCTGAIICGAVMVAGSLPAVAQTAAPTPDVTVATPDPVAPLLPVAGDDDLDDQDDEDDLDDSDDEDDDDDDDDDRDDDSDDGDD